MPALSISIPQMVDLALATPDLGGMNLTVLHALMQIIVNKMELNACRVEFRGAQSDVFENLVERMPIKSLIQIEEYELDTKDTAKRYPISKNAEKIAKNIFTIKHNSPKGIASGGIKETPPGFPLQPIQVFSQDDFRDIDTKVLSIHDVTVSAIPTSDELLNAEGGGEHAITEMWKLLNIEKRLEAVEAALRRVAEVSRRTEIKINNNAYSDQHSNLLIELVERVGKLEEALSHMHSQGAYIPQPIVPVVSNTDKGSIGQTSNVMVIGESHQTASSHFPPATEAILLSKKDKGSIDQTNNLVDFDKSHQKADLQSSSSTPRHKSSSAFTQQIIDSSVNKVFELLCNDPSILGNCEFLDRLRNSILKDLRQEFQHSISQDRNKRKSRRGTVVDQESASDQQNPIITQIAKKNCKKHRPTWDNAHIQEGVIEMKRSLLSDSDFINGVKTPLRDLHCGCSSNVLNADDIRDVYDRLNDVESLTHKFHHSTGEGSLVHYRETLLTSLTGLKDLTTEFNAFRNDFLQCMIEVQDMLDAKMDKHNVPSIKQYVSQNIDDLRSLVTTFLNKKDYPEAMTATYSYVKDLKCISCNTEVCMKDQLYPANLPKYPKAHESSVLQAPQMKPCFKSSRFCGGPHTVTCAEDRLWRKGHFVDQFGIQPPQPTLNLLAGADGNMYRVDPPKEECICFEPVQEEKNRCLEQKIKK